MPVKAVHRGKRKRRARKQSRVVKRSVVVSGRNTAISLEATFWDEMQKIAMAKRTTRPRLIAQIKTRRKPANLSSAVRLFVLAYYQGLGR